MAQAERDGDTTLVAVSTHEAEVLFEVLYSCVGSDVLQGLRMALGVARGSQNMKWEDFKLIHPGQSGQYKKDLDNSLKV